MPRGTWRSTPWRWRWSIPISPRSNSFCCCANGTCTPTGSCRPTSGRSATSTRRCTPGRLGACTRSKGASAAAPTARFLERVFHKLLLNFTWWVNRKDPDGMNVFQGGFLGLDNIGVFDRSQPLPTGGHLEQSDGTSWMGMYCLNMLAIALELAREDPAYEDVASKFFEHFVYIAQAMNDARRRRHLAVGRRRRLLLRRAALAGRRSSTISKVRSHGGPDSAICGRDARAGNASALAGLPAADAMVSGQRAGRRAARGHEPELAEGSAPACFRWSTASDCVRMLGYMLDQERVSLAPRRPRAFQVPRGSSLYLAVDGSEHRVDYEPAESQPACSAEIPTGAARSGFRRIF